jgi:NitT/TauT family transport system permease protein
MSSITLPLSKRAPKKPVRRTAFFRKALVPIVLVVLWEVAARMGAIDVRFIPPPSKVLTSWYYWIFGTEKTLGDPYVGTWTMHALQSAYRVLLGFAVAAVVGIVLGIMIGYFRLFGELFDPLLQVLRPIPITAWVPFAVIFFGIQTPSAVFLIALGAFFPIVVNTTAGVNRVPRSLIRAAEMLGTPRLGILPRVILPAALPSIFTGLRIGFGMAWVLVVVSEMLAVKGGLGYVLWDSYYYMRMDIIIAAMLSIGLLGFASDWVTLMISNHVVRWNEGK